MLRFSTLCLSASCFLWSASIATAQDWVQIESSDQGLVYAPKGQADGPLIRTITFSDIERACSCRLADETDGSEQGVIEYGLSILWIDAYDLQKTKHESTPHLYGEAETENGTRQVFAGLFDSGSEQGLRVYISEPDTFSLAKAKSALSSLSQNLLKDQPSAIKNVSNQSSKDLLAGVRGDVKASSSQANTNNHTSKKPTTGASLLAGIRGDMDKIKQKNAAARAVEREKAERKAEAARQLAAKTALRSSGYPVPLVMSEGSKTVVYNWDEVGEGDKWAKANDAKSPRIIKRKLPYKTGQSDETAVKKILKDIGLSRVKLSHREVIDVTRELMGIQHVISIGTAKRKGHNVNLFVTFSFDPKTDSASIDIYEAAPNQWKDFGGVAVPLTLVGVYKREDFTEAALKELKASTFKNDLKIYEEHYTAKMTALFQGIMMSHTATLNSLSSLAMSTGQCAGVENCTVTMDGVGGYDAVITE